MEILELTITPLKLKIHGMDSSRFMKKNQWIWNQTNRHYPILTPERKKIMKVITASGTHKILSKWLIYV